MTTHEEQNEQRFLQVRDAAWQAARGGDTEDLKEAFGDYFRWHEELVQDSKLLTFGGLPYSQHNRAVCAGQLARAVRFDYNADEQQLRRLSKVFAEIIDFRKTTAERYDALTEPTTAQQRLMKL